MRFLAAIFLSLVSIGFILAIIGTAAVAVLIGYYSHDLPDYNQLKDYRPPVISRVYAGDGRLLTEFAEEKRVFIPIHEIPDLVKEAFIAAEDQNFYNHPGIDYTAIARAALSNLKSAGTGRRPVGASTITQQVAKNFLLTNEVSIERKIKEAILSVRMEKALPKERLLELYLNEIFLGNRSYGVGTAALNYFNKSLNELTIAEAAYLAALPKAPNNYHPVRHKEAAVERRNWVINRMLADGYIPPDEARKAAMFPLVTAVRSAESQVYAPYFADEIRRDITERFGDKSLLGEGFSVRSTLDPAMQLVAERTLREGLMNYDRRHGWRGAPSRASTDAAGWKGALEAIADPQGKLPNWETAIVASAGAESAKIGLRSGSVGMLKKEDVIWAQAGKGLHEGDVILVEAEDEKKDVYKLRQVPLVQGALVALDPHTGRVLAMQGGWGYEGSVFNRVTQAYRQPGSAFKPFVYLAALDDGYTPSSRVLDGPITYTDTAGNVWRPENYSNDYLGPTPIRVGVEKSRNLMTIRLAQQIGIDAVMEYANKFGIGEKLQRNLSNVLGAGETTLLNLTNAYAMLVNGGKKIVPTTIDRIQDRYGKTIYKHDARACAGCGPKVRWEKQESPAPVDNAEQIADPRTAYQMVSILEGVVQRGTAQKLKDIGRPVAGKTGTTNDSKDAWFIGFTPDLAVGVFVGFDQPKSLGEKETGGSVAAPIFKEFVKEALKDVAPIPFRIPAGIKLVRVNPRSGERAAMSDPQAIWEAYVSGTEPADVGSYAYEPVDPMNAAPIEGNTWDAPYDPNNVATEPQAPAEIRPYEEPGSAVGSPEGPIVPMAPSGEEIEEDSGRGFQGVY